MRCRIQLELPDRPGSLGTVTSLLGRLGVDIHQLVVLDRNGDRALDELIVAVPGEVVLRSLPELLQEIPGVRVRELCRRPEPAAADPARAPDAAPGPARTPALGRQVTRR